MTKMITAALALALLASTAEAASAQDHGRGHGRGGGEGGSSDSRWQGGSDQGGGRDGGARGRERPAQAQPQAQPQQAERRQWRSDGQRYGNEGRRQEVERQRAAPDRPQWRNSEANRVSRERAAGAQERRARDDGDRNWRGREGGQRDWNDRVWQYDGRNWNRGWSGYRRDGEGWNGGRQARPRYDRRYYPPTYRVGRRYHGPAYRHPVGFYARSWSYGDFLPAGWYEPEYLILEWWAYGLPVPPVGFVWVRIGDDAMLIDEFTGQIVQVAPNLFW
jgi:Ni/Co efflux regulator RcnB